MLVDKEDEIVLGWFVTRYNTFVQLQIYKLFFFLFFDDISFNVRLEFINMASFLSNGNKLDGDSNPCIIFSIFKLDGV